ncbi:Cytosolic copper metallochaperone [Thecaphora frezii]
MSDQHEYQFEVVMTCSGCSGAVTRVLSKLEGVSEFDVSLEKQTVIVKGTAPYEMVLQKIEKTGKQVKSGKVVA